MRLIELSLVFLLASVSAQAISAEVLDPKISQDKVFNENFIKNQAAELQLSVDEIKRYNETMDSPAGFFYKRGDANIYYVLSAEAKTDQERMKYARLWVSAEAKYAEKLGLAINAYSKAAIERFGKNPTIWDLSAYENLVTNNAPLSSTVAPAEKRAKFYVNTKDCPSCNATFSEVMGQLASGSISGVDIYFVDSSGDRDAIFLWAASMKIPQEKVKSKKITLNFDDGKYKGKPPHVETYYILN